MFSVDVMAYKPISKDIGVLERSQLLWLLCRRVVQEKQKRQNLKGPSVDFFEIYIFE